MAPTLCGLPQVLLGVHASWIEAWLGADFLASLPSVFGTEVYPTVRMWDPYDSY